MIRVMRHMVERIAPTYVITARDIGERDSPGLRSYIWDNHKIVL